ncbi:MAG: hypothetical protein Q7T80_15335, partial [Methanoregula sp.]|nr:hypothetical protein [Methanoregula sp.]
EIVDDGNGGEVLRGAILHSPEADLHVTLPYTGVEEQFELHDRASGTLMKSVNLSNAITTFSRTYPSDPAGPAIVPSYEGMPFLVIIAGCVIFFFLILVVLMMVRKG